MGKVRFGYQNFDRDGRNVTSAMFLITFCGGETYRSRSMEENTAYSLLIGRQRRSNTKIEGPPCRTPRRLTGANGSLLLHVQVLMEHTVGLKLVMGQIRCCRLNGRVHAKVMISFTLCLFGLSSCHCMHVMLLLRHSLAS